MKQPIKMTPGDDLHLTLLMAPQCLNLVDGQLREQLLGYGRAAFEAGKAGQCLHQIQEPAPVLAAQTWPIEVTGSMALAFHRATSDEAVGPKGVNKIKEGLAAALAAAAPAVLPEPTVIATSKRESPTKGSVEFTWGGDALKDEGEHKLYTEPQVRALLAGVSAPAAQAVGEVYRHGMGRDENGPLFGVRILEAGKDLPHGTQLYAAPQAQADARHAQWLQPKDFEALQRFEETASDNQGHDIGKAAVARLAGFGCLQSHGFGTYSITDFGHFVLDDWEHARALPFRTQAERDADQRSAIAAAKGE